MPTTKPSSDGNVVLNPVAAIPDTRHSFPVVGIGASAGGLEAASILFKELSPRLGMAFVLVLHLDPARESAVTEILARVTPMPVVQAKEGMRWNAITLCHPPNCEMTIDQGVLHLQSRVVERSPPTPPSILSCGRWRSVAGVPPSGSSFPEPLRTAPWVLPRSKEKQASRLPRNQPPPSTTACRRARSPQAVSTSSWIPRALLRKSHASDSILTSPACSRMTVPAMARLAIWNRYSGCCAGDNSRFLRLQSADDPAPHSAPDDTQED